jgi:putative hydrolase of the HAD superfamily
LQKIGINAHCSTGTAGELLLVFFPINLGLSIPFVKIPINTHTVETILLDFGGVLFEITSVEDWLDHHINPLLGTDLDMPAFNKLYQASECGELSESELKASMEQLSGNSFSMEDFASAWNGILLGMPESSMSILHRLAARYDLYLLSNTNAIHYASWWKTIEDKFGVGNFEKAFRGFFYSHELGCVKPGQDIYRKVHDLLGRPSRSSVLFFDDKKENADAAGAFGWQACHVDLSSTDLTAMVEELDLL